MDTKSPLRFLHLIWLIPAWTLQYMIVVPAIWVWRHLLVPAFRIGFIGVVLLLIPILGWIILAVLIFRRPPTPEQRKSNAYAHPWGASLIK